MRSRIFTIIAFFLNLALCSSSELCIGTSRTRCCDPEGGTKRYPIRSTYVSECSEFICARTSASPRLLQWKRTSSNMCPPPPVLPCPSNNVSCIGKSNTIDTVLNLPSYASCGEHCKQNSNCTFWTYQPFSTTFLSFCHLLKSCDESKDEWKISGNNLCPLKNPLPCPSDALSCVAEEDSNVVATVPVENYEYCGVRCMENSRCKFWTFLQNPFVPGSCKLLDSCAPHSVYFPPGPVQPLIQSGDSICPPKTSKSSCSCDGICLACLPIIGCTVCIPVDSATRTSALPSSSVSSSLTYGYGSCGCDGFCVGCVFGNCIACIGAQDATPSNAAFGSCGCDGLCLACVFGHCTVCIGANDEQKTTSLAIATTSNTAYGSCGCDGICVGCFFGHCTLCIGAMGSRWADGQKTTSLALEAPSNVAYGSCGCDGTCLLCAGFICAVCVPFDESTAAVPNTLPEVCSNLALGHHYGNCSNECENFSNDASVYNDCITCLVSTLPEKCSSLPEFPCLTCAQNVWTTVEKCSESTTSPLQIFKCAVETILRQQNTICYQCLCSLICFFWPHGMLCQFCQEDPIAADFTYLARLCPQGAVSSSDGICFKAYKDRKTFAEAQAECGELAKVSPRDRILAVNQAMAVQQLTECWIGGRAGNGQIEFKWVADNTNVTTPNFARGFPTGLRPSCMTQSTRDGQWRNYDCNHEKCYVCQVSMTKTQHHDAEKRFSNLIL